MDWDNQKEVNDMRIMDRYTWNLRENGGPFWFQKLGKPYRKACWIPTMIVHDMEHIICIILCIIPGYPRTHYVNNEDLRSYYLWLLHAEIIALRHCVWCMKSYGSNLRTLCARQALYELTEGSSPVWCFIVDYFKDCF